MGTELSIRMTPDTGCATHAAGQDTRHVHPPVLACLKSITFRMYRSDLHGGLYPFAWFPVYFSPFKTYRSWLAGV
jgi:hypothetical protein